MIFRPHFWVLLLCMSLLPAVQACFAQGGVPELMYYRFDGASGSVTNLASTPVGTNPAMVLGALSQGPSGQFGNGLIGSGNSSATDYVNTGWATTLTGSWTLSLYLKGFSASTTQYYIFGDNTASEFSCFTNGPAGTSNLLLHTNIPGWTDVVVPGAATANPSVTHFVYDASVPEIRAYFNGNPVVSVAQPALSLSGSGPFKIGGYDNLTGIPAGGILDEFRLYDRALSPLEITYTWSLPLPLPFPANDLGITAMSSPATACGLTASEQICVTVQNSGLFPQSGLPLAYSLDNGPVIYDTAFVNLNGGASTNYCFNMPVDLSVPGPYSFSVWTSLPGDTVNSNDTLHKVITHVPQLSSFPYLEDFESGPGGWTSGGQNVSWEFGAPQLATINSAASGMNAWVTGFGVTTINGNYLNNEKSFVISPCFDFSTLAFPKIRMNIWWESEFSWDGAVLQASTNGGTSWQTIGSSSDPDNWYTDFSVSGLNWSGTQQGWTGMGSGAFGPGSQGWVLAEHALDGLGGEPDVRLRIAFGSDGTVTGDGFAFDDVEIVESPAFEAAALAIGGPDPSCGLSANEVISLTFQQLGVQPFNSIDLFYRINGGTPVMETYSLTVNPGDIVVYSFSTPADLSQQGSYVIDAWLSLPADPDPGNDSLFNFQTEHRTFISLFPYTENFDNGGQIPAGWINDPKDANQDWWFWQGPTPTLGTGPPFDHTTGLAGYYAYVEDSGFENDSVNLVSPCLDLSGLNSPELRFWYHSNESNGGANPLIVNELHVDVWYQGQWYPDLIPPIGHVNNQWNLQTASLSAYPGVVAIRFRVNNNNGAFSHDIGIDDFTVTDILPQDAGILGFVSPNTDCDLSASEPVTLLVSNEGTDTIFGLDLSYAINGGLPVTESISTLLPPGDTLSYLFTATADLSSSGTTYQFTAWASGLAGDTNFGNDTLSGYSVLHRIAISVFPYFQDFENSGQIPSGWINDPADGLQDWLFRTGPTPTANTGPAGDHTSGFGYYAYVEDSGFDNDSVMLVSPCFDLSSVTNPQLSFWYHSKEVGNGGIPAVVNSLHLDIFYLGAWIQDIIVPITHKNSLWNQSIVDLTPFAGGIVLLRFRVNNNNNGSGNHDIAIDDIEVTDLIPYDAGLLSIERPLSGCGLTATQEIDILLAGFGTDTIFSLDLNYSLNGGITVTETLNDTIAPGDTLLFTFQTPADMSATNAFYTLDIWASGLLGDTNTGNDTLATFTVFHRPAVTQYPYAVAFEPDGTLPPGWINDPDDDGQDWLPDQGGTPSVGTGPTVDHNPGTSSGWYYYLEDSGQENEAVNLLTPCFDLGGLVSPEFSFWYHSNEAGGGVDTSRINSLHLDMFFDGHWLPDVIPVIRHVNNQWNPAYVDLTAYVGEVVSFRFRGNNNNNWSTHDIAIDDIRLVDIAPHDLGVINLLSPEIQACGDSLAPVVVVVENLGSEIQFNYPVSVSISGAGTGMLSLIVPDTLLPGQTDTLLMGTVNTYSGGIYDFIAATELAIDQHPFNDTLWVSLPIIGIPAPPPIMDQFKCEPDSFLFVSGDTAGFATYWYNSSGGPPVFVGDTFITPLISSNTVFFASRSVFFKDELTTNFTGGNSQAGNMFDLQAINGVVVDSFDLHIGSTMPQTVEIYSVPGSYIGNETNASAWTLLGTQTVTGSGPGLPTRVHIGGLNIPAGQSMGIYITLAGPSNMDYSNGPGVFSTNDLVLTAGVGKAYPFDATFSPRTWNGTLYYSSPGCPGPSAPFTAGIYPAPVLDLGPDAIACAGIILDASGPGLVSFLWNTGDSTSAISALASGSYFVTATDSNGCSVADSINLTLLPAPQVDLGPDTTACSSLSLNAGNPGSSYVWSTGATGQSINVTASGTYTVTVTEPSGGCQTSDAIQVVISQPPIVDLGPDFFACLSATLDAGNPGATYLWSTGDTGQSLTIAASGTYSVTVTSPDGCQNTDAVLVTIGSPPMVDLGPDLTECDETTLTAGLSGASYLWSTGQTTASITIQDSGWYAVEVTNAQGCSGSDSILVNIIQSPVAAFITTGNPSLFVQFVNQSTGSPPLTYLWDFGDGTNSTLADPLHYYAASGAYTVTLTLTNVCGSDMAFSSANATVGLEDWEPEPGLFLFPNPNDGHFRIRGEGLPTGEKEVRITDGLGRQLLARSVPHQSPELDMEIHIPGLSAGIYFVEIRSGSVYLFGKMIVQ